MNHSRHIHINIEGEVTHALKLSVSPIDAIILAFWELKKKRLVLYRIACWEWGFPSPLNYQLLRMDLGGGRGHRLLFWEPMRTQYQVVHVLNQYFGLFVN